MNKLLATLIAGLFVSGAFAQAPVAPVVAPAAPAVVKAEAKADKATVKAVESEAKVDAKADAKVGKAAMKSSTTKAKASTYVLRVADDGKRSYLSSLWDSSPPGTYALEYRGIRYAVTLTDDAATITSGPVGTPPYINRGSGNSIAA